MQRHVKIKGHTLLLKVYKVIANETNDNKTKESCERQ